jgi:4-hydroxybenzoate polyprenyltransferase
MALARRSAAEPAAAKPKRKAARATTAERLPLVLDLDGSLIASDLLLECALLYLRRNPLGVFMLVLWTLQGRSVLKAQLAERTEIAVDLLPENEALVAYARQADAEGREVHMATGADRKIAEAVSQRYPFIREVLASGGHVNLKGKHKAAALKARFPGGFVYAGDSSADRAVWREAKGSVYAGLEGPLHRSAGRDATLEASAPRANPSLKVWAKALRVHQWAKNGLVFAPMILAGKLGDLSLWATCMAGFLAMGLIASATYLINDLADLEDDRRHWSKRNRPLASGALPLRYAMTFAPLALIAGLSTALAAGGAAGLICALVYCVGTLAYSFRLKRVPLLDVVMLAGLFTVRLMLGSVLAETILSNWLLVFSMFLFASLGFAKRGVEIDRANARGSAPAGRGYLPADAPLVSAFGASTAVAAVIVLVMYLIEDAFPKGLYRTPDILWGAPVLLALWLGRIWLLCGRGQLNDDPVAFAVKDPTSLVLGAATAACFVAALVLHG